VVVLAALSCLAAQGLSSPLVPAYLNAETGEVLVRVARQLPLDQEVAADSSYAQPEPLGRMKIQVYRGPNVAYGKDAYGHEDSFAPWGYYNTQPADLPPYH